MNDKGDKVCPLCTEEMDLTDQQLKPCKCGYEICVWCWNHIMEMADIKNSKGRCPACRSPYDKERIVGMAANCERLVAEINSERKLKSQKVKPKMSEGRMHLNNVRVIQRNLVYIIGLPLNLADEGLLQQREYFGQYGKVLKVSISKTATGVIQHSSNNSCCVYITYSKEEEAVRCIQSVHSFVLEGRSLRACFGTTKYCHAWLKNMPCCIPDCLYLHEFGSQEDRFTKDDLVSAFTRSRVQQIIGATNNSHRSGTVLPPPADEYKDRSLSSTAKLDCKTSLNQNTGDSDDRSYVDGGTERSNTNPGAASWVMCVSSNVPAATTLSGSGGALSHKPETSSIPKVLPSEVASTKKSSDLKGTMTAEQSSDVHPTLITSGDIAVPAGASSCGLAKHPCPTALHEDENFRADEAFQGLCSALSLVSIANHIKEENPNPAILNSSIYKHNHTTYQGSRWNVNMLTESSASSARRESSNVENLLGFDDHELKGSGDTHSLPSLSCLPSSRQNLKQSGNNSWQQSETNCQSDIDAQSITVRIKCDDTAFALKPGKPELSSGFYENQPSNCLKMVRTCDYPCGLPDMELGKYLEGCDNAAGSADHEVCPDMGESSIISSILSMDMDTWEDTLTLPQSLIKLLAETDKEHGSLKMPSLRKVQDGSQSRFSFARQDDFFNQDSTLGHSLANAINDSSTSHHCNENKDTCMVKYHDNSSYRGSLESNSPLSSHPFSTSKFSEYHLMQNTAPSSRKVGSSVEVEFIDPALMEVGSGMLAARLKNPGFDMRPALSSHLNPFDHDTQFQTLVQQPISVKHNHRLPDHFRNRFSHHNDSYGISSVLMGESPPDYPSPFAQVTAQQVRNLQISNGCWGGWDEMMSVNNVCMSEFLMNGRLGFDKIIPNHEDLKYQMSGSSNLYSRGFAS